MLSAFHARDRNEEGFTLIELLIVVIIIGILAAIALPIFIDQQKVAVDASVQSDVRNTVTNITNAQAQAATSAKVANTRAETSLKVYEGASTDPSAETNGMVTIPKLGDAYAVEGKNAGGKQYATKVFRFNSVTGSFGAADATVPAGKVMMSSDFEDGMQGWQLGDTPGTIEVATIAGRKALHITRREYLGNANAYNPFSFSNPQYIKGKTYKLSAMVYIVPSADTVTVKVGESNGFSTPSPTATGSWQQVSTTFVAPQASWMQLTLDARKATRNADFDFYIDDATISQMD